MAFDWVSVFAGALTIVLGLYLKLRSSQVKSAPPGPRGIPFIGNVLSFGKRPHVTMTKWKEEYGDVYRCYSGQKPMVVLSDFNTVRKVFADDVTAGRDNVSPIRVDKYTMAHGGLIFSEGNLWKTHRRFALQTLRDLGMGKNWLEDNIINEVEILCQTLRKTNQTPYNPKSMLNNSVANVICALIFGKRFELTDPKFSRLTNLISQNIEVFSIEFLIQAFPVVMWFPNFFKTQAKKAQKNMHALFDFLKERVHEHNKVTDKSEQVQDYVFAYQSLVESDKQSQDKLRETFDEDQLVASLNDLFQAGSETTSTTTLWAFVFMLENPDIMLKVQEEIDSKFDRKRPLTNADRGQLPYTEAMILEVQRCAALVPLGLPHWNHEEITIDGYTIPKDTVILANWYSIHRDPRYWKNPEKFDPFRFLDADMKLIRPDGFAPFSIGKRACLGEALAKMELFLFIANLLRCFTIQLPAGKTISREDYSSSVVNSPLPFELIFVPRT